MNPFTLVPTLCNAPLLRESAEFSSIALLAAHTRLFISIKSSSASLDAVGNIKIGLKIFPPMLAHYLNSSAFLGLHLLPLSQLPLTARDSARFPLSLARIFRFSVRAREEFSGTLQLLDKEEIMKLLKWLERNFASLVFSSASNRSEASRQVSSAQHIIGFARLF